MKTMEMADKSILGQETLFRALSLMFWMLFIEAYIGLIHSPH